MATVYTQLDICPLVPSRVRLEVRTVDTLLTWGSQVLGLALSVNSHAVSIGSSPESVLGGYYESDGEWEECQAGCVKK